MFVTSNWGDVYSRPLRLARRHVGVRTNAMQHCANRLWLDSTSPPEKEDQPGGARGPCPSDFRHPRRRRVVEARRVRTPTSGA